MNRNALNIFLSDRTLMVLVSAILIIGISTAASFIYAGSIRVDNSRLETQLSRMITDSAEIIRLNAEVRAKEKKAATGRSAAAVSVLEQILKELGIEARAIRPLGKNKINGFTEENTELEIKGTDLNRAVNLLYRITNSGVPMKIKSSSIKTTFEDPDKFIIKLTVSRISKG